MLTFLSVLFACNTPSERTPLTPPPTATNPSPTSPADPHAPPPTEPSPHGTPSGTITVPVGARGILESSGNDLILIIPAEEVPGFDPTSDVPGTYALADQLVTFGAKGVQARFNGPDLILTEWCREGGKPRYRIQGRIPMPGPPPKALMLSEEAHILSFVQVGDTPPTPAFPPPGTSPIASGDLDADGKPDALLVKRDASCPEGHLELSDAQGSALIRCCH